MKMFISGKITGDEPNIKEAKDGYPKKFKIAQLQLERLGHLVMNPAILPEGFEHQDYMEICYKMIDACELVVLLRDWGSSKGARMEKEYAIKAGKGIILYDDLMRETFLYQLVDMRQEKDNSIRGSKHIGDNVCVKDYAALDWAIAAIENKECVMPDGYE